MTHMSRKMLQLPLGYLLKEDLRQGKYLLLGNRRIGLLFGQLGKLAGTFTMQLRARFISYVLSSKQQPLFWQ